MANPAAKSERVLTRRQLNRALLARQGLLDRHGSSIPRTLERIGMIQAQYAPAMYVGLWSRMHGVSRAQVTRALQRRTAVQGTHLRATIHLVSREDYWPTTLAIRRVRREWHLRAIRRDPSERQWLAAADRVRAALADGPLHRREIDKIVGETYRSGISLWLDLVRVPPSGTWEHRPADVFALAEDWVGPEQGSEIEGVELLVHRYLQGFGPAMPAEIASWAGLPLTMISSALAATELRRFQSEAGKPLVDLPRAPLPDPDVSPPVRFLPTWDATLLIHARRTQVLPEEHRPKVFSTKNPHSIGTVLVDGAVAASWRHEAGRIQVEPFEPFSAAVAREVADEAEQLTEFFR